MHYILNYIHENCHKSIRETCYKGIVPVILKRIKIIITSINKYFLPLSLSFDMIL